MVRIRTLIGWNEFVDLPDWGVKRMRAKVDTGARNSALHVDRIEELPRERVRFEVVLHRRKRDRRVPVEARIVRRARVRSSTGKLESRIFVATRMQLGPVEREIEISLVSREKMIFRMLLGRSALEGAFTIDPARRHLLDRRTDRPRRRVSRARHR